MVPLAVWMDIPVRSVCLGKKRHLHKRILVDQGLLRPIHTNYHLLDRLNSLAVDLMWFRPIPFVCVLLMFLMPWKSLDSVLDLLSLALFLADHLQLMHFHCCCYHCCRCHFHDRDHYHSNLRSLTSSLLLPNIAKNTGLCFAFSKNSLPVNWCVESIECTGKRERETLTKTKLKCHSPIQNERDFFVLHLSSTHLHKSIYLECSNRNWHIFYLNLKETHYNLRKKQRYLSAFKSIKKRSILPQIYNFFVYGLVLLGSNKIYNTELTTNVLRFSDFIHFSTKRMISDSLSDLQH